MSPTLASLSPLLGHTPPTGLERLEITGVSHDSRRVRPGDLFCAIPGVHVDGHDYLARARQAGAVAALVEREVDDPLPQIKVERVLDVLGGVAAQVLGHPSRKMLVWAVTGSNGKTSTTYLLESVARVLNLPVGVVGTIDYRWPGNQLAAPNTTPNAADLQDLLARMEHDGVRWVALEVSSHAIVERRADHTHFAGAVFTNLSPEHLDYHETMQAYLQAKARLFDTLLPDDAVAAINVDDEAGRWIAARSRGRVLGFGLESDADVRAEAIALRADGASFTLRHPGGSLPFESRMLGRHNVYNVTGAATMLLGAGIDPEKIAQGVAALDSVPGRLENLATGGDVPFSVTVDYAHSPDGLLQALTTLQELPHERIITVMGCGGNRDRAKRPVMGRIAETHGDVVIVTSDNPRREAPQAIIDEIVAGMRGGAERHVVVDRAQAIALAVELARPGDVVLIAGKGHETYQEINDQRFDFDDRTIARQALKAAGWNP